MRTDRLPEPRASASGSAVATTSVRDQRPTRGLTPCGSGRYCRRSGEPLPSLEWMDAANAPLMTNCPDLFGAEQRRGEETVIGRTCLFPDSRRVKTSPDRIRTSERDDLVDRLLASGFDPGRRSVVTWMGVTYYPTPDLEGSLDRLARLLAPDSALAFDYVPPSVIDGTATHRAARIGARQGAASRSCSGSSVLSSTPSCLATASLSSSTSRPKRCSRDMRHPVGKWWTSFRSPLHADWANPELVACTTARRICSRPARITSCSPPPYS